MKLYFPHIEGLRFVAALLVAIYHIWTDRISGGVDVFFVVSGLLITLTLLRQIESRGSIHLAQFLARLALRLLPAALLVLILVLIAVPFLLPPTQHLSTARQVLASILYYQNWELAFQAVDYLDRDNPPSPVQHFWAMSVQGQFYIYAAAICFSACWLRRFGFTIHRSLLLLNGYAIGLSLGYSIYQTYFGDQIWAYFDTFARIWEFGLGAILALLLTRQPRLSLPVSFGWVGLVAILLCGIIFDVAQAFPGVAALFPVTAALLVILGGRSTSRWSVQTLLGSPIMISLGSISYGLYLFHWPLLIFYQQVTGHRPTVLEGSVIVGLSIALAYLTNRLIEQPVAALSGSGALIRKIRLVTICFVPAFGFAAANFITQGALVDSELGTSRSASIARPIAEVPTTQLVSQPRTFTLSPRAARMDRPVSYEDGCHANQKKLILSWCTYGVSENYTYTIAIVGGSHAAHWLPALQPIAERNKWRILYSTWSGCRFKIDHDIYRCKTLSQQAVEQLADLRPDLLFTSASTARAKSPKDRFPTWIALQEIGIQVIAPRGTPRFGFNVPDCLAETVNYEECGRRRKDVVSDKFDMSDLPANAYVFDLTPYFCNQDYCPPSLGEVIVYSDASHISATFARMLSDAIEEHIVRIMSRGAMGDRTLSH